MPLLPLNLAPITAARAELAKRRDSERRARAAHAQADAELKALLHGNADARTVARAQALLDKAAATARDSSAAVTAQLGAVRERSEALRGQQNEAALVAALDTRHPVLLMPVSIQTRYDDAAATLMIRIYPDVLHTWRHDPGLSAAEVADGKRYWAERFAAPADAQSPWTTVALLFGPMRAAYVVRTLTPTNLGKIGSDGAPEFDDAAIPLAAANAREVIAAALPDRFVALGWRNGVEVLRKWGSAVADLLPMSPLFDPLLVDDPKKWNPFAGDRAWLVDYAAAQAAGMAISVTDRDLRGARVRDGLDRLIVLGVDWTQTPESAAQLVAELLHNHQHGEGLKFVAQGTPTNNTGAARAGFAADASDVVPALEPGTADAQAQAIAQTQAQAQAQTTLTTADELAGAGARLQLLLGLPAADRGGFDASLIPGAALQEGATSGHMTNALWSATLGFTLRYFWNPLDNAQSLIDDAAIEQLRAHAVRYLRPGGPLSALRVGNQPYGILPISARAFVARTDSPLERELLDKLERLRGFWQAAVPRVPRLGTPSADALHQVLSMQPWPVAKRFWQVLGPTAVANHPELRDQTLWQVLGTKLTIGTLLQQYPFGKRTPFISGCYLQPKAHSLDAVAWVQRDPANPKQELAPEAALARNFIAAILAALSNSSASPRAALLAMQNAESLLEALLAFAADEEVLASSRRLFYGHIDKSRLLSAEFKSAARQMRYAEYVGLDTVTKVGDQFDIGHAAALLDVKLTGTTGNQSVAQFIGAQLGLPRLRWPEHLKNVASFNDSLAHLAARPAGELDQALRTTLDAAAHRLDAWITSLATKRLDQMREAVPTGLHIGAFGIVEDLVPDARLASQRGADSLGYVHAPSVQQAVTACVLRSGHLANREAAAGAFNLDLRSRRVKDAKRLLEGIANGQSMAALLGYRFERALRDDKLSQHILELRRAFPLTPNNDGQQQGEAVGVRDVTDGVRLVAEYRAKKAAAISALIKPATELPRVAAKIDTLIDLMDAVSDLLVAESVHQLVGGNLDASAAAMAVLDQQQRPPEPRVVETPRSTRGCTQRVVVAMQSADAGSWAALDDLAAQVEPRLNAWLARLLGDASRYRFFGRVLQRVETGELYDGRKQYAWQDSGNTLQASITELGLSPLALVLGSEAQRSGGQSGVQERLAAVLSAKAEAAFGPAAKSMAVVLDAQAPADAPADSVGLVAFESFAWLLRRLLDKARALRRMDMVNPRDGVETEATVEHGEFAGIDLDELRTRLAVADKRATQVLDALGDAIAAVPAEPDPDTLDASLAGTQALLADLQAALAQAETLGWRSALASQGVAQGGRDGQAVAPQDTVAAALARAIALRNEVQGRRDAAPLPDAAERFGAKVRMTLARLRAIMGQAFPVLPLFTLGALASEPAASLAQRDTLLAGDDLAIAGWLPKLGCVHEAAGLLADVLTAAEAMGLATQGSDFKLMQTSALPKQQPKRWASLPPDPKDELRGVLAVVAHAPDALATLEADSAMAGLFIDEWNESIPSATERTALGFHFDAPGARAPQSLLLAVPSDLAQASWTLDALVAVIDEALALSRLRAVRQQDLQGLGLLLPGLYLSNNFKRDVPSADFKGLLQINLEALRAAYGHSATSTVQMAAGKIVVSQP
jgi:hypothetical protein